VQVTVKVLPEHAASLRPGGAPVGAAEQLLETLRKHDASLTPLHPRTTDETIAPWFTAEVSEDKADGLLHSLRSSPAVEAAYVKPADEPP
jgi:hypothetical protein